MTPQPIANLESKGTRRLRNVKAFMSDLEKHASQMRQLKVYLYQMSLPNNPFAMIGTI
jgi:hypothetical protein